jgi:hypothetical protein
LPSCILVASCSQVVVHWNEYRLEVFFGETRVCTVQIYLARRATQPALYVVDVKREDLDIFPFKRFWLCLREQLAPIVEFA